MATLRDRVAVAVVKVPGFQGVQGPAGPAGPPGPAGMAYIHTQSIAALNWVINHNLGFNPSIELFTTGGLQFIGDVIHTSLNQSQILLTTPIAGTARLN